MYLTNKELSNINGGGLKLTAAKWVIVGGIATFIIGFVNGILRPLSCKTSK
jgi:lactobin A/cerein 7B family class IIb bacteriocin